MLEKRIDASELEEEDEDGPAPKPFKGKDFIVYCWRLLVRTNCGYHSQLKSLLKMGDSAVVDAVELGSGENRFEL